MIISGWLLVAALVHAVVVVVWLLVLGGCCWLNVGSCTVDSRWWFVVVFGCLCWLVVGSSWSSLAGC